MSDLVTECPTSVSDLVIKGAGHCFLLLSDLVITGVITYDQMSDIVRTGITLLDLVFTSI